MPSATLAPALLPMPSALTQLRRALAADTLRLRRTAALWLALGSGAFPVALSFLIYFFKGHLLLKPGQNPWSAYLINSWQTATGLLLPLFVVLLAALLLNVENKATAWKHVYAQPVSRAAVLGSKLLLLMGLNGLAQLVYALLLVASGWLLGALRPELRFLDFEAPLLIVAELLGHTFVASLGLLAIQLVASLWWRSFTAPVALGMGATITALTLMRWEYIDWVPYAAPLLTLKSLRPGPAGMQLTAGLAPAECLSLAWFGVMTVGGYVLLGFRHERSPR